MVHGTELNSLFSWYSIWLLANLCIRLSVHDHLFSFQAEERYLEISPSETVGVFDVKAKLLGVHLETVPLQYQVGYPQDHLYFRLYFQTRISSLSGFDWNKQEMGLITSVLE